MSDDEPKIEPYYRNQGKFLVDTLFDLGLLSESLSRDGIDRIEDLVALMFQQHADAVSRCSGFTKKYKKGGEDGQRHEEEMRWIARAKEAETRITEFEAKNEPLDQWHKAVVDFLREVSRPPIYLETAADLLNEAFELGVAEPDLKPGRILNPTGKQE
jgi:hypothetical protein